MKGFGNKEKKLKRSSIEKILSTAFDYHSKGNILEAEKYYNIFLSKGNSNPSVLTNLAVIYYQRKQTDKAINLLERSIKEFPKDVKSYSNLATIFKDLDKLKEAEIFARKAIKVNPNYANSYANLGAILEDLGNHKEAEYFTRKAISINKDFANAHYNLSTILLSLNNHKEAEKSIREAIRINPNSPNYYCSLGNILTKREAIKEAFYAYYKAIKISPNISICFSLTKRLLKIYELKEVNKSDLHSVLILLFKKKEIPHLDLFNTFNNLYKERVKALVESIDDSRRFKLSIDLINENLVKLALRRVIFKDLNWEILLTSLRRYLIKYIINNKNEEYNDLELETLLSLSNQCFYNEYIFFFEEDEKVYAHKILSQLKNEKIDELKVAMLSCYYPIHTFIDQLPLLNEYKSKSISFQKLLKEQLIEPKLESELSKNISKIGSIKDKISIKVMEQYQENPYPRWKYGYAFIDEKYPIRQSINNEISPNSIEINSTSIIEKPSVLIAGCGTGQQILQAQRYKNAEIIAIDLSKPSLCYAQRKTNELRVNNVKIIQMDLMDAHLLNKNFDIIECSGVLHHMRDPQDGLKSLKNVLKKDGFIKLGLYSELARQNIKAVREYIQKINLEYNYQSIRNLRSKIISGELKNFNKLLLSSDFYSISSCRDLIFHAQEHRYSINQLKILLENNQLDFHGFILPHNIKSLYKNYFSQDKSQTNLQNWANFEEKHPMTFLGMYQFWASKS
tara:strand:+ start:225 stop:2435 length:2211 start_codon:yes stop_codon:yes gene_type:complete